MDGKKWAVVPHDNYMSDEQEPPIQIVDGDGNTVACNTTFYPTAISPQHAATIVAAVNGENLECVATVEGSDPYDDRGGPWFSQVDLKRLDDLPRGTKLYIRRAP